MTLGLGLGLGVPVCILIVFLVTADRRNNAAASAVPVTLPIPFRPPKAANVNARFGTRRAEELEIVNPMAPGTVPIFGEGGFIVGYTSCISRSLHLPPLPVAAASEAEAGLRMEDSSPVGRWEEAYIRGAISRNHLNWLFFYFL
jgi:hypothetical protein